MIGRTKKIIKRTLGIILFALIVVVGMVAFANWKIPRDTEVFVFDTVDSVPPLKVALVLGAARYLGNRQNLYFTYRIQAAKELYEAGKVKVFVVSGDNSRKDYNEAHDMRDALVEAGIPDSIIHCDYAGLRTLDSVVRMKEIFGQDSFIVVSQKFHNERAVFLAQHYGLTAYGYNAKDVGLGRFSYRTKIRELFARVKVFVDIVTGKGPKYLGDPIEI
ncbi:MAG: YdcF family protein [Prevotella sp.]|jgi:SanA protein|nr:YdcF family protein [Prevotella sp.]